MPSLQTKLRLSTSLQRVNRLQTTSFVSGLFSLLGFAAEMASGSGTNALVQAFTALLHFFVIFLANALAASEMRMILDDSRRRASPGSWLPSSLPSRSSSSLSTSRSTKSSLSTLVEQSYSFDALTEWQDESNDHVNSLHWLLRHWHLKSIDDLVDWHHTLQTASRTPLCHTTRKLAQAETAPESRSASPTMRRNQLLYSNDAFEDGVDFLSLMFVVVYATSTVLAAHIQYESTIVCLLFISNIPLICNSLSVSFRRLMYGYIVMFMSMFLVGRRLMLITNDQLPILLRSWPLLNGVHAFFVLALSYQLYGNQRWYTRRMEEFLEKAMESNQAKDDFLACMSHELRNPLHALMGGIHLLYEEMHEQQSGAPSHQRTLINSVKECSQTLNLLLSNVLDASKISADRLEVSTVRFSLARLIERATSVYGSVCGGKGIGFNLMVYDAFKNLFWTFGSEDLVRIDTPDEAIGDEMRILQIMNNLLSNAVKFTGEGGVELVVRWLPLENSDFELAEPTSASSPTDKSNPQHPALLEIHVIDTGIGIKSSFRQKLFQKFTQQDSSISRSFGGSGLGLFITGQLAKMMGGRVTYRFNPHKWDPLLAAVGEFKDSDHEWPDSESTPGSSDLPELNCGSWFTVKIPLTVVQRSEDSPASRPNSSLLQSSSGSSPLPSPSVTQNMKERISESPVPPSTGSELENTLVFVVDDNAVIRSIISKILKRRQVESMQFQDARDALSEIIRRKMLHQQLGAAGVSEKDRMPDLVLLDLQMPKMDGFTFMEHLGRHKYIWSQLGAQSEPTTPALMTDALKESPLAHMGSVNALPTLDLNTSWSVLESMYTSNNNSSSLLNLDDCDLHSIRIGRMPCKRLRPAVVVMTGNSIKTDRDRCMTLGADAFLSKPVDVETLFRTLSACRGRILEN